MIFDKKCSKCGSAIYTPESVKVGKCFRCRGNEKKRERERERR